MKNKKTVYVWIVLVFVAIGVVFGFIQNILSLINIKVLMTPSLANSVTLNIVDLVLSIIGTVLLFVYFIKLYNLPQNIIKWTNIVFGYFIFELIFSLIISMFTVPILFVILQSIPTIIISIIIAIIWFTFVRHLRNKYEQYQRTGISPKLSTKDIFLRIIGIVFIFVIIISFLKSDKEKYNQQKINEENASKIVNEDPEKKLPSSFIVNFVKINNMNKFGDIENYSEKLTVVNKKITEGEAIYKVEEGQNCTTNCLHEYSCVINNSKWVEPTSNSDCPFKIGSNEMNINIENTDSFWNFHIYTSTIERISQNSYPTILWKTEDLSKCSPNGYTCYKITEI